MIQLHNHKERRKDEEKLFGFRLSKYFLVELKDIRVQFIMQLDIESEVFGVAVEQFERTKEQVLNEFVSNRTAEGACLKIVK